MSAPTPGSDETARLVAFLHGRDQRCPLCGYNLRDLTRDVCPECRQSLELTVGVRDVRFGWFLATITPGLFSGIAALMLLLPMVFVPLSGGGVPPPGIFLLDLFGLLSGATALVLIWRRRRFIMLSAAAQQTWAALSWAIHVLAFVVTLVGIFYF